jgi:Zn-dependent protease
MITSLREIFYLIILTVALGYIFSGFIRRPGVFHRGFNWEDFKLAMIISAPAVILHELAHKFTAIAQFYIWPFGLLLAVFLRAISSPFLIIAPGYVEIASTNLYTLQGAVIAAAGPLINLALFFTARTILNRARNLTRTQAMVLYMTKQINLLLFVFNMLPIPPLDGSKVIGGLFSSFF